MADTTGPILAIGAITVANNVIVNNKPIDWRVPIATGIAAGMFALAEKAWRDGAVMLAYVGLVTILFVRVDPKTPAPVEAFNKWYNGK
jgi:hypothetical protein